MVRLDVLFRDRSGKLKVKNEFFENLENLQEYQSIVPVVVIGGCNDETGNLLPNEFPFDLSPQEHYIILGNIKVSETYFDLQSSFRIIDAYKERMFGSVFVAKYENGILLSHMLDLSYWGDTTEGSISLIIDKDNPIPLNSYSVPSYVDFTKNGVNTSNGFNIEETITNNISGYTYASVEASDLPITMDFNNGLGVSNSVTFKLSQKYKYISND